MKNRIGQLSAAVLVVVTAGCSNNSHVTYTGAEGASLYSVNATPDTPLSRTGQDCGSARGQVWIKDGSVGGVLTDNRNVPVRITGTQDRRGNIEAGVAVNGQFVASWHGELRAEAGSGRWSDSSGCEGSWSASAL